MDAIATRAKNNNRTCILYWYLGILFFLIFLLPGRADDYPHVFLELAKTLSTYIPIIKVFSVGSFNPIVSLFYGSVVYISTIMMGALFFIIPISGCNAATCMALDDEFSEDVPIMWMDAYRVLAILIAFIFVFSFFFIIPDFYWYPKSLPFGFFSGVGLSKDELIRSINSGMVMIQMVLIEVYYSKFALALFYVLIISSTWIVFFYFSGILCRTLYCKITSASRS